MTTVAMKTMKTNVEPNHQTKKVTEKNRGKGKLSALSVFLTTYLLRNHTVFLPHRRMKSSGDLSGTCNVGGHVYEISVSKPLTEYHRDVLLAIALANKTYAYTINRDLVIAFTAHQVLRTLGDRYAKNTKHLWDVIREIQTTVITLTYTDNTQKVQIRFPLISTCGRLTKNNDDNDKPSRFQSVHHAGATADASYYYVRVPSEAVMLALSDMRLKCDPNLVKTIMSLPSYWVKSIAWKVITNTRINKPLDYYTPGLSKQARYKIKQQLMAHADTLKSIGIHIVTSEDGGGCWIEWDSRGHIYYDVPAKAYRSEVLARLFNLNTGDAFRKAPNRSKSQSSQSKSLSKSSKKASSKSKLFQRPADYIVRVAGGEPSPDENAEKPANVSQEVENQRVVNREVVNREGGVVSQNSVPHNCQAERPQKQRRKENGKMCSGEAEWKRNHEL